MKLEIRSCRINVYKGSDKLDITVKSGRGIGKELAPSWELVRGFKSVRCAHRRPVRTGSRDLRLTGKLSWDEYEAGYLEMLRKVWVEKRWVFRRLFRMGRVTFVCYCRDDRFCHRRLLREVLVKIGKKYGIEVVDGGELKIQWY